ncbi:MAG TPA: DUF885 domain-containing protein [Myxococcaceae bacterium]|jgi:uncharacterized protein (DUF885 family)
MPTRFRFAAAAPLLVACACSHPGSPMTTDDPAARLQALAAEYWEDHLKQSPVTATHLGDRRYDGEVSDESPEALEAEAAGCRSYLERARQVPEAPLSVEDQVTRAMLIRTLENQLAGHECHFEEWVVDHMDGEVVGILNLPSIQRSGTPEDRAHLLSRWRKLPRHVDQSVANLRRGLAAGKVATADSVGRTQEELDKLLAQPAADWSLMQPAAQGGPDFARDLAATIDGPAGLRAAFTRYRDFLRDEVKPKARPDDRVGLKWVPGGSGCYARQVSIHTTLDLSPAALHQLGLDEVKRIEAELSALGRRALGTGDLKEIQRRLRSDPSLFFQTREEVEAKARSALAAAQAAAPRSFGRLPRTPCVVKRIEPHEEANTTIAYYKPAASDGSRPGTYYINTFAPQTRPRYEAEVLAFHEAVPGHHLQISMAQELEQLPAFRRHSGATAFMEGWGLYSERLADELGLYSSDLDRMGMLSFDAWRACRLVVDTGMHELGWSRQQAIQFMLDHSVLAENNVVNEISRYTVIPGQALAYKAGQLEILRLRREAERRLGKKFDLAAFHDELLRHGAVALSVLREQMERWIAARE